MKAKQGFQVFIILWFSILVVLVKASPKHRIASGKAEVPHLCDAFGESSEECFHRDHTTTEQGYTNRDGNHHTDEASSTAFLTAKGDCRPIPPPLNVTDDSHLSLQERLANGKAVMVDKMLEIAADDKAVFILGNTGSGKSTVTQLLTGDLSRIYATKPRGSKSYVIFDEDDKIGRTTTKSKTLIPEFVVRRESGTVFVDCPGFDDTRTTDIDIAGMYFLKYALASVTQAKFLFTVIFPALESGIERTSFDLFVTHAVTLLKNPKAMKPAIGLIVTKVNRVDDDGDLRTREDLLTEFQVSMEEYIKTIREKLEQSSTDVSRDLNQWKIDLVEIFLSNLDEDKLLTRVTYIRKPEACGALAELPEMMETREMLTDLYTNHMSYTAVSPEDFRISLKPTTILEITQMYIPSSIEKIRKQTEIGVEKMGDNIVEKFHQDLKNWEGDPPATALQQVLSKLQWHIERIQNNGTGFSRKLFDLFTELGMTPNDKVCITNEISDFEDQLVFFEMVSGSVFDWPPLPWMEPLKAAKKRIEKLHEFYEFCQNVDEELGTYYKQLILEQLARQGTVTEFQTPKVLDFLKDHNIFSVPSNIFEIFQSSSIKEQDQSYLSGLVKSQIPRVTLSCEPSSASKSMYRLKVTGRHVKLSDIVKGSNVPPPHPWPNACSDNTKVDQVSIFAQDAVFFNADLTFDCRKIHVSIVAPEWEVIGASKIDLGCAQVKTFKEEAGKGATFSSPGKDGKQGESGVDSGTFFGMLVHEINGNGLEISTNGGQGGTGQTGGQGYEGYRGKDSTWDDFPGAYNCMFGKCGEAKVGKVVREDGSTVRDSSQGRTGQHGTVGAYTYYHILGRAGSRGGNGGRGGDGGIPGKPGVAQIIAAGETADSFILTSRPGAPGKGGKGGTPDKGGISGSHYSCRLNQGIIPMWQGCYSTNSTMRASGGDQGRYGDDKSAPVPTQKVPLEFVPWRLINEYKAMFGGSKFNFSSKLDTHPKFLQLQTPLSFAEELVAVETTYYKEKSQAEPGTWEHRQLYYLHFYERFLQRIKAYAKVGLQRTAHLHTPGRKVRNDRRIYPVAANDGATMEDKVALNYIYVTVLGKLVALRQNLMSSAKVIDTQLYFNSVEKTMAALKEVETDKKIAEESSRYKAQLDKKIEEANDFIEKTVLPAISKTEETLDDLNDQLAKEVQQWLEKAKDDELEMKRLKNKLEAQMPLRYLFGGMKMIGTAAQFLGPVGKVAGTVVVEVGGVASDLSLDKTKPPEKSFDLPKGFSTELKKHSKKFYEKKIETVKSIVNATKQVCDQEGPDLAHLKTVAEDVEKVLKAFEKMVKAWSDMPEAIVKKEKELTAAQKQLGDQVEKESKVTKKDVVKHLNTTLKLASAGIDIFKDIVGALNDIKKMEKIIEGAEEKVKKAEAKQMAIYNDFIPLLEEAMADIHAAGKSLEGQSQVGLSVKRWKVQGMLEDMQNTMTTFTSGLDVETGFLQCVDTIKRAVSLLIELYNHIERYEEKKELADYIANINSVKNAKSLIKDDKLRTAITDLEFLMQANLFLQEYQVAMSAFKQWVFPFPKKYLTSDNEEMELAGLLDMDEERALNQTLDVYQKKVTSLSTTIMKYRATTQDGDELLMISSFEHNLTSTRPFFTWKNDKWRRIIVKLLSGSQIQLKADLDLDLQQAEWFRGKSAFKYKCIRLSLRATNPNHQSSLDELLKNFHMRMEHSGISEYRALEQKYVMFDSNQTYKYSFEDVNGKPVTSNVVKQKICQNGDYLMSPYTWWTFRLLPANNAVGKAKFDELVRKYGSQINLDLEGDGLYLDEKYADAGKLQELELDQFYQSYDDTSLIEFGGRPTRECEDTRSSNGAIIFGLNTCPRGVNWSCFKTKQDRDEVASERQWIIFWVFNPDDQLKCYCCRQ